MTVVPFAGWAMVPAQGFGASSWVAADATELAELPDATGPAEPPPGVATTGVIMERQHNSANVAASGRRKDVRMDSGIDVVRFLATGCSTHREAGRRSEADGAEGAAAMHARMVECPT
jgi:hypothetical protein